jgi:prepilin-type N-terminal cleavage/methylation domain-containing protein
VKRLGFTLVEVLVAVVVLEVGLLGVVGTLWLAALTLARAERTERGVAEVEFVYDSLATLDQPASGVREGAVGTARWWVQGRDLRVEYAAGGDSALVALDARTPTGRGG